MSLIGRATQFHSRSGCTGGSVQRILTVSRKRPALPPSGFSLAKEKLCGSDPIKIIEVFTFLSSIEGKRFSPFEIDSAFP